MKTYTADEVDEMIGRALAREREQRKPLTDDEIVTLFNKTLNGKPLDVNSMTNFARSIEAKLKEKNSD